MRIFGRKYRCANEDFITRYGIEITKYGEMQCSNLGLTEEQNLLVDPITIVEQLSDETLPNRLSEQTARTPFGTISSFYFDGLSCFMFKLRGAKEQRVAFRAGDIGAVQLVYLLDGGCKWYANDILAQKFKEGGHNGFFLPAGSEMTAKFTEGDITLVIIGIERHRFLRLSSAGAFYQTLVSHCSGSAPNPVNHSVLPITPDQSAVLYNIVNCKRSDFIRYHYIKAKVEVLLALDLEQSAYHSMKNHQQVLREEELQRVYKVRDMLQQKPSESYSLVGLAHQVGTNDATLKKHFKQVFGTTVFAYLTACRMELAKSLLLKNNQKVAVVAQEVGYKYASHFSTAFRKYFGYLPTKLLQSFVSFPISYLLEASFLL